MKPKYATIADVKKYLFYSLTHASWYARDRKHMMRRWKFVKSNTPQLSRYFWRLSKKKRDAMIDKAWRFGVPRCYVEMRKHSRQIAISQYKRYTVEDLNHDAEETEES